MPGTVPQPQAVPLAAAELAGVRPPHAGQVLAPPLGRQAEHVHQQTSRAGPGQVDLHQASPGLQALVLLGPVRRPACLLRLVRRGKELDHGHDPVAVGRVEDLNERFAHLVPFDLKDRRLGHRDAGRRLEGPRDAMLLGLADNMIAAGSEPGLRAALADCHDLDAVAAAVAPFKHSPPEGVLARQRDWIDRCYAYDSVEAILAALDDDVELEAQEAARDIRCNSPTALKVTLNALRAARSTPDLAGCLEREFRMMTVALRSHDLLEGIRARVIDKDGAPRWDPATLQDARSEFVHAYFRELFDAGTVAPTDR